jgi:hypothetical protein
VPELRLELAPEPERAEVSREGFEQVPFELEPDLELNSKLGLELAPDWGA